MKKNRSLYSRLTTTPFLTLFCQGFFLFNLILSPTVLPAKQSSKRSIEIEKITIGEEEIFTGQKQLIEVLLKNYTSKKQPITVKLSVTLPNQIIITYGSENAVLKSKSETRVLISYPIDKKKGGDYTIGTKIYTRRGKLIKKSLKKQNKDFFAIDPTKSKQIRRIRRKSIEEKEKAKLIVKKPSPASTNPIEFDPPDLSFESVSIQNNPSVLRGETAHVRIVLINTGGDIAEDVEYTVSWYFEPRKSRKIKFDGNRIKIIAPGERKVIQLPLTIPEAEQKGYYIIQAVVDESNYIKETDEKNNTKLSSQKLYFSDITLVFPEPAHSFAEDGRFLFQWISKKYNQFKIQISSDEKFLDQEQIFELPKGDKWESAHIIKPLIGEMPAMGIGLMESYNTDHLFWRVRAQNSQGDMAESSIREFYIKFKAN